MLANAHCPCDEGIIQAQRKLPRTVAAAPPSSSEPASAAAETSRTGYALATIRLALYAVPDSRDPDAPRQFDWLGALTYGLTRVPERGWRQASVLAGAPAAMLIHAFRWVVLAAVLSALASAACAVVFITPAPVSGKKP